MITKRIIPCLDVKDGRVVKGVKFEGLSDVSSPVELGKYYSDCGADELVFYDITASAEGRALFTDILTEVAQNIFIPLTVGGGINTLADFDRVLKCGADKVSVNSGAIRNPELIREAANQGGHIAIQRCLTHSFGHRDHWYYLYLAGKAELSWRGNTPESYFSKAYDEMKGNVYATGEEYVRNLALLAPYDERAGREYESLTTRLNFKLESSEPETLSGALKSLNGRQVIKVLAKPSEKTRYLDITLGQEVRGFLTLDSSSREISNNHVRLEFSDSRGKSNQLLINSFTSMDTIPKKMKLVIGPRQQPLELKIGPNLSK